MSFLGNFLEMFEGKPSPQTAQLGSSLSRVYQQMLQHDTGFMTAWKNYVLVGQDVKEDYIYWSGYMGNKWGWDISQETQESSEYQEDKDLVGREIDKITADFLVPRAENENNQAVLRRSLRELGYGVTDIRGYWIENYRPEYKLEDTPEYEPTFKEIWEIMPEDSLFVVDLLDRGTLEEDLIYYGMAYSQDSVLYVPKGGDRGYLIGTNDWGYPMIGNTDDLWYPVFGQQGQYYSRVAGRPFILKSMPDEGITTRLRKPKVENGWSWF